MTQFRKALQVLTDAQVDFVIIGGVRAALIRSKRAAGREKDLSVLPELESLLDAKGDEHD